MTTLKSKLLFTMLASLFVTAMAALVPTVEGSSVTVASASTAPPLCQGGWLWAAYQGSAGTTGNIIYSIDIINDTRVAWPATRRFRAIETARRTTCLLRTTARMPATFGPRY
jgi:hypothetical protein